CDNFRANEDSSRASSWFSSGKFAIDDRGALPMKNGWTGGQCIVYRAAFGLYLFTHFIFLLLWAKELFSNQGAFPDASLSPFIHAFPNILAAVDFPAFVQSFILLGAVFSVFFAIGKWDKIAAIVIWYIWACLLGRNP